jgi:hypothetical protein
MISSAKLWSELLILPPIAPFPDLSTAPFFFWNQIFSTPKESLRNGWFYREPFTCRGAHVAHVQEILIEALDFERRTSLVERCLRKREQQ